MSIDIKSMDLKKIALALMLATYPLFPFEAHALKCKSDVAYWWDKSDEIVVAQVLHYQIIPHDNEKIIYKGAVIDTEVVKPMKGELETKQQIKIDRMFEKTFEPAPLVEGHSYVFYLNKQADSDSFLSKVCAIPFEDGFDGYRYQQLLKLQKMGDSHVN